MKNVTIVLPAYNEAENIEKLIPSIFETTKDLRNWKIEVLVVDSNSPDKSAEVVKKLQNKYKNLHLLSTEKEGLGKAYTLGFKYAIEKLNAFVIFEMDSDLQHDPKEIPHFLQAIADGADFVIGSRYMKGGSIPANWGIHRKIFSIFGNIIIRTGFMKFKIKEWTSGYRAVKSWIIKDAANHLENYSGYVFQIALLDFAIKKHAKIKEVPIQFKDRVSGESKISFGGYIFTIFAYIFNHSSFVKFVIVGSSGFIVDIGLFYLLTKHADFVTWHANLISTESAVITNFLLNNFWSFAHKRVDHRVISYLKGFVKFNIVASSSIAIQTIGVEVLQHLFGSEYLYFYKVGIIVLIIIPYSYFFYNRVIWKDKK